MKLEKIEALSYLSKLTDMGIRVFDYSKNIIKIERTIGVHYLTNNKNVDYNIILSNFKIPNDEFGVWEIAGFLLLGYLNDKKHKTFYLIGPNRLAAPTKKDVELFINSLHLPLIYKNDVENVINTTASLQLEKFLYCISAASIVVLNKKIIIDQLIKTLPNDVGMGNQKINKKEFIPELNKAHSDGKYEEQLISIISNGMTEQLNELTYDPSNVNMGKLGPNDIRSIKNGLIILNSICLRAAILGGIDTETAYALGEYYAQKIEGSTYLEELYSLSKTIKFDYCNKVKTNAAPKIKNALVNKASRYIENNLYSKLFVSDIAEYIGVTPEYLVSLFKKELNVTLSHYIIQRKISEAKKILKTSSKSIQEISDLLCFATQSHFQNTFKKETGLTPRNYKKEYFNRNHNTQ